MTIKKAMISLIIAAVIPLYGCQKYYSMAKGFTNSSGASVVYPAALVIVATVFWGKYDGIWQYRDILLSHAPHQTLRLF